jgi:serine phosphatase RsbU (regulator of sigma subunit)
MPFLLAVLVLAALAYRANRVDFAARVPAHLGRFALFLVAWRVTMEAARVPMPLATHHLLLVARAAASLALWYEVAWLSTRGEYTVTGRRVRGALAVATIVAAVAHVPWPGLAVLTVLAVMRYGWVRSLGTRQLFAASAIGVGVLALGFVRLRHGIEPLPTGAWRGPWHLAKWANAVAVLYATIGLWHTLAAFVRDPSLGIRQVRARLALSHTLVLAVPLAITIGLWVITTWLGVGADRALQGRRAVDAEGHALRAAIAQALGTRGGERDALRGLLASRRADWPAARAWLVRGGGAERVAGDSVAGESNLAEWCTGLDSLPPSGVVDLSGVRWFGAAARDSAAGTSGVVLVPVLEALAASPARAVGARLWIKPQVSLEPPRLRIAHLGDSLAAEFAGDSAGPERLRSAGRPRGANRPGLHLQRSRPAAGLVTIATESDTVTLNGDDFVADTTGLTGRSLVPGLRWTGESWTPRAYEMRVSMPFSGTLSGLFANARENPLNAVPIAFLVFLAALLVPVALFNFRLVGQLGRSFVQPVQALREGTSALAASRLDHRIAVRGEDELWDTARAFNQMTERLEAARELEKERDRLEHELDLARRIQRRLLPAGPPDTPGAEIAGISEPAREVGGDYFDHIPLGAGRVMLVIADVSGKGVPAALLMSAFRAALMSQDADHEGPAEVTTRLNAFLHRSVEPGRFVTAFVGFLDAATGRCVYANAGHNPPLLLRADGRAEWLSAGGLILGILPDSRFESGEAVLEPGDLLVLYTDGVTEGADATGEQFGEERLVASVRRLAGEPCAELAERLVREVRAFEGESGPADDLTLLVARRPPAG